MKENGTGSPILESIKKDITVYKDSIKEVASEILKEGLSEYPIFVAHQHEVSVGEVILDKNELEMEWSINASTLEQFIEKGIIDRKKSEGFKKNYKDPKKHICLFVLVEQGANFVYIPY
ncbi:MAG: hypothetical protein COC01_00955 [Bacteroidetes bacterium]|nr:hypothetical protein [Bacteroidia bacterium]PCH69688.1 MAG: hypothetical protein COC01_00955 [Bacteroidota bacterium]